MATTKEFHDYVMECLNRAGVVTSRKMMGEYCLYFDGKYFAGLFDNQLLVKQTETSSRLLEGCKLILPYEGSKTEMLVAEDFENPDLMRELMEGMAKELPAKK